MPQLHYTTLHGITVTRSASKIPYARGLGRLLKQLDTSRGAYLSSGYEYPERYSRWDVAMAAPPIEIIGRGRTVEIQSLNRRGNVLIALLGNLLRDQAYWESFEQTETVLTGELKPLAEQFSEEERSKQPSLFSVLRTLIQEFRHPDDSRLALIGAFGYDLLLQFDPIRLRLPREAQKDLHLFLCDDIYFMDRKKEVIERFRFDFAGEAGSTAGIPRTSRRVKKSKSPTRAGRDCFRSRRQRVHGERRDCARGHAPRQLLRSCSAADVQRSIQ